MSTAVFDAIVRKVVADARAERAEVAHSTLLRAAREACDAYEAEDLHVIGGAARHHRAMGALYTLSHGEG